jgi:hypothetical protein
MTSNDIGWLVVAIIVVASIGFALVVLTLALVPLLVHFFRQRFVSKALVASGVLAPSTLMSVQRRAPANTVRKRK